MIPAKGLLRHIRACNNHDPRGYRPLIADGLPVGSLRRDFAEALRAWPEVFLIKEEQVELICEERDFAGRSRRLAGIQRELVEGGVISHLHGEQYVATPGARHEGLFLIDRAAAPFFGIRGFGQHLNGFVRDDGRLLMWVARRSQDRKHYPGHLDNLAAGGLPHGAGLAANLAKECDEEAAVPPELAAHARPVGVITYNGENPRGYKPDTLYCYDLDLPQGFVPRNNDGEVERFFLWPVEQVLETVRDTDAFKLNCNLVVIDFLIRHGYIGPDDPEYIDLVTGLHPPVAFTRMGREGR